MASLFKRTGSPYWFVAFDVVLPSGETKRFKKSTKKKSKSEANVEGLRLEEAERKHWMSSEPVASKAYAILSEAAEAAARGELSEARAREMISKLAETSTGQPLKFYTPRSWASDWLQMKAATGKVATLARYTTHITAFVEWLGTKADGKLEAVTKSDVRGFRDAIRKGWLPPSQKQLGTRGKSKKNAPDEVPRTGKTTNHYASDVAGMLRAAVREGLLLASPAAALERLSEEDSSERETFSIAEIGSLVAAAGDPAWQDEMFSGSLGNHEARAARCRDWQGMILTGFYVGPRLGDCAKLTTSNLNLQSEMIDFMPAKTSRKRKRLSVPIHPRMMNWLRNQTIPAKADVPLFPSLFASSVGGRHGLSSQFIAIMEHAGIDRRTVREGSPGGQRAQHARSFHALRHSLTSTLANADVSEEIRRRIVGHDSLKVHAGYTHHERGTLVRALEKIPDV